MEESVKITLSFRYLHKAIIFKNTIQNSVFLLSMKPYIGIHISSHSTNMKTLSRIFFLIFPTRRLPCHVSLCFNIIFSTTCDVEIKTCRENCKQKLAVHIEDIFIYIMYLYSYNVHIY